MDSNKIEHLKMIQGVITRLAQNSFMLKGWTITLLVAGFAFLQEDLIKNSLVILFFILPVFIFWCLDSYYLMLERCYRDLYEHVRNLEEGNDIKFNMNYGIANKNNETGSHENSVGDCMLRPCEIWFYIPLLFMVVSFFVYSLSCCSSDSIM